MARDFDIAVIGGGAAGLTAAGVAANLGAKTLLVERDRLGGDCTWTGCVPSKTLLHAASVAETIRHSTDFGVAARDVHVDFARVMKRVRDTRQTIYEEADAPEVYEEMGVSVVHGSARFVDPHTLLVDEGSRTRRLSARRIVIATGSSPVVPPIDGLSAAEYLTNETLFELERQPDHLIVIGAGPVGIEMAQAFRRLGSAVTVVDLADRILTNDDPEPADLLKKCLADEGVRFVLEADIERVRTEGETLTVALSDHADLTGDALLVATGRRPNVSGLDLEAAGVRYDQNGIQVDGRGRTSVRHVYAAGDVTGRFPFTHMAEHSAKTAVMNALYKIPNTIDEEHVPWVTYTEPELAHVGATERQLRDGGRRYEKHRFPYRRIDRAVTDGAPEGVVLIYAERWRGRILGASVLGARAGEMISEVAVAMRNGISLRRLSDTIHPYPSYGLGVRRAADQWYVQRHSPRLIKALRTVFGYRGEVKQYGPDDIL